MQSQSSLKQNENWIPICLPGISPDGFIYTYISFLTNEVAVVMITDDNTNEGFFNCSQSAKSINEKLKATNSFENINAALKNFPYANPIQAKN